MNSVECNCTKRRDGHDWYALHSQLVQLTSIWYFKRTTEISGSKTTNSKFWLISREGFVDQSDLSTLTDTLCYWPWKNEKQSSPFWFWHKHNVLNFKIRIILLNRPLYFILLTTDEWKAKKKKNCILAHGRDWTSNAKIWNVYKD